MPKTFGKFERAYARLKGLILRSAHAGKLPQTPEARKRVSKDEAEQVHAPSCFETHRSAAMPGRSRARARCDAPQHEGRGRTAHFCVRVLPLHFTHPESRVGGAPRNVRVQRHPLDMP